MTSLKIFSRSAHAPVTRSGRSLVASTVWTRRSRAVGAVVIACEVANPPLTREEYDYD